MKNYLSNYDYVEGVAFEGLIPEAAEKIGVIGGSEVSVEMHGHLANGMDALEVVDIEKAFESETTEESTDTPEAPESEE